MATQILTGPFSTSSAHLPRQPLLSCGGAKATRRANSFELFDLAPVPLVYIDASGKCRKISKAYELWCGVPRERCLGRHYSDLLQISFGPAYFKSGANEMKLALAGESVHAERYVGSVAGEKFVRASYTPDFDQAGEVQGVLLLLTDLTEVKVAQKDASDARNRFCLAAHASGAAFWESDHHTNTLAWDAGCFTLMGFDPINGEPTLDEFVRRMHPEDRPGWAKAREHAREAHTIFETEFRMPLADGTWRWIGGRGRFIRRDDGRIYRSMGVVFDISSRKRSDEMLLLHRQALEALPVGISIAEFTSEKDYPLVFVNPAFEHITGYSLEDVKGKNCRFLQGSATLPETRDEIRATVQQGGSSKKIVSNYRKDGSVFLNELQISPVHDSYGTITHLVGIQVDVTEQVAARDRLARQAHYDGLTGIPNSYTFMRQLQQAVERAAHAKEDLAVIYLDVDNLKHVNDKLGHAYGDHLLTEIAKRLAFTVPSTDMVARLGGDEFGILCCVDSGPGQVDWLMNRINDVLSAPLLLEDNEVVVTSSVGYSIYPRDGASPEDLLRMANLAMYAAKSAGKNTWRAYRPCFERDRKNRLVVAGGLREALREGQFFLDYQPRVNAGTNEMCSMEALIRWRHPVQGNLPPAHFIDVAEETGLIREMGFWVMQEAVRQSKHWEAKGLVTVPISINVSPAQFRTADFTTLVTDTIRTSGLTPNLLEIEITESLLMDDSISNEPLQALRHLGIRVSIDDFGTGYSGLSYLARFPVDTLKIDRSFTRGITQTPAAAAICRSIIDLSTRLNLTTVAEGIESEAQAALLRGWGCDELQGYHLGRPMRPEEIETRLKAR